MRPVAVLAVLTALSLPGAARPHEEEGSWEGATSEETGVDVSVGLSAPGAAVSIETFRGPLSSEGDWVTVAGHGEVWRPRVGEGWRPYYHGRWEWTSEGWLWVSDEPFGWATYHYGRWTQDPYYGWVWIPGYQWAPAWVTWRHSPDYVGWAPLGPGFSVYVTSYPVVYPWWTFVPCGYFAGYPIARHAYAPAHLPAIWRATRPAPPRAVAFGHRAPAWGGPARGFVEARMGRPVHPVRVMPVGSPAGLREAPRAGVVPIYRPEARPGRPVSPGVVAGRPPEPPRERVDTRPAPPVRRESAPGVIHPAPPSSGQHWGGRPPGAAPFRGDVAPAPRSQPAPTYRPPAEHRAGPAPAPRPAPTPPVRNEGGRGDHGRRDRR